VKKNNKDTCDGNRLPYISRYLNSLNVALVIIEKKINW